MWLVRVAILFAAVLALTLLFETIRRRRVRRTAWNWQGARPNPDLDPAESALLAGEHPATVLVLLLSEMDRRGRARWSPAEPDVVRPAEPAVGPVETALRDAVPAESRLGVDGALGVLDALHASLEEKMVGFSGPATVRCRRALVTEAKEMLDAGRPPPGGIETLLLSFDANEVWGSFGEGPEWGRLRALFRAREGLRRAVLTDEALSERAARSAGGFLAFRRDLVVPPRDRDDLVYLD